jgi:nucleoid-associated protein YgaU
MTEELKDQKKDRLLRAAVLTETQVDESATKAVIAAALEDNDVDLEYYNAFVLPQIEAEEAAVEAAKAGEELEPADNGVLVEEEVKPERAAPKANDNVVTSADLGNKEEDLKTGPEKEEVEAYDAGESDEVLVRYTGFSRHYEKKGYKFTKDHPFAPVPKDKVDDLLDSSELLRMASPREAQDFYA